MSVDYQIYDRRFFRNTIEFEAGSAQAAAGILYRHFQPKSVIDIGCGCGIYLRQLQALGVEIAGYDGSPAALEESLVGDKIKIADLSQPFFPDKKYDLCLCFEVAEHLPAESADVLVDSLVRCSDIIAFTAAIPGQGPKSIGHINEQPHEYWIKKFQARKFAWQTALSEELKEELESAGVVWWIVQNLMIFKRKRPYIYRFCLKIYNIIKNFLN